MIQDLPHGLIMGAAFWRKNGSIISMAAGRGVKPAPESPWVPFISSTGVPSSKKEGGEVVGWRAASRQGNTEVKVATITIVATWDHVCTVKPSGEQEEPDQILEPATQPIGGSVAWEDDGTLQYRLRLAQEAVVKGFISVQVDANARGVQPQDRQLIVVVINKPYGMELGAEMGVPRGTQWWYPGTPLQCKVVNRSKASLTLKRVVVVAWIYPVNTSDKERMRMAVRPRLSGRVRHDRGGRRRRQPIPVSTARFTGGGEWECGRGGLNTGHHCGEDPQVRLDIYGTSLS